MIQQDIINLRTSAGTEILNGFIYHRDPEAAVKKRNNKAFEMAFAKAGGEGDKCTQHKELREMPKFAQQVMRNGKAGSEDNEPHRFQPGQQSCTDDTGRFGGLQGVSPDHQQDENDDTAADETLPAVFC